MNREDEHGPADDLRCDAAWHAVEEALREYAAAVGEVIEHPLLLTDWVATLACVIADEPGATEYRHICSSNASPHTIAGLLELEVEFRRAERTVTR